MRKTKQLPVSFSDEERTGLEYLAERQGSSLSTVARGFVRSGLMEAGLLKEPTVPKQEERV